MALVLTNIYLVPDQKKFLERQAKRNGSHASVKARNAIDLYKLGITAEDMEVLDKATVKAKRDIDEMIEILDKGAIRVDAFFKEIERIKQKSKK
jgi:hypothetical protein